MAWISLNIKACLDELRRMTETDFAGLAINNKNDDTIRWRFVSGNRNDRYQRMIIRHGQDVAGSIVRSGRPMIIESFTPTIGLNPQDFPILLAEDLKSIVGVPIYIHEQVVGVLMVGCRRPRTYDSQVVDSLQKIAKQIGAVFYFWQ